MRAIRRYLIPLVLPAVLIGSWWLTSDNSTSPYYPPLSKIVRTFFQLWVFKDVGPELVPSLQRFGIGFGIAAVAGIAGGLVVGRSNSLRRAVNPLVDFVRSIPPAALVPITLVLFGIGNSGKVFVIALGSVWPVFLNSVDGVRSIDPAITEVARCYRLRRSYRLFRVELPAASPQMFAGLRIAVAVALTLMIVSEMVASTSGLGYFTLQAEQTFAVSQMWTGVILLGLLGIAVNFILVYIENHLLAWHKGWRKASLGG